VSVALRCPVCRAADNRGPQCRRCKADLSLLVRLEEERQRCLQTARQCAFRGEVDDCLRLACRADLLRSDAESLQLLAVAHLLRRDFAGACWFYRQGASERSV
jgi:hypothetical protein